MFNKHVTLSFHFKCLSSSMVLCGGSIHYFSILTWVIYIYIVLDNRRCYVIIHHVGVMLKALMLSPLCFGSLYGFGGLVLVI